MMTKLFCIVQKVIFIKNAFLEMIMSQNLPLPFQNKEVIVVQALSH